MSKKKKPRPDPASLGFPLAGIETHAHMDLPELATDIEGVLARARAAGVERLGNVFLGPDAYENGKGLFEAHPEVFFVLGVHPNDTDEANEADVARIVDIARADPRIKAVGEIGLDYYWKDVPPEVQKPLFMAQIEAARELSLPVVIHSRDAEADTLKILDDMGYAGRPLIWHCFGGDEALAGEIISRGWLMSVPGIVTYRKTEALGRAVKLAGAEKVMLETDCPFLTPEPYRGKQNEPAYLVFTATKIAEILEMEPVDFWRKSAETARQAFSLAD